jgi:hypothetical protein
MLSAQRRLALCSCVVILAMQGAMAADAFRDRFLNTGYHYFYDNAFFTTCARHANALGMPANRLGVVAPVAHRGWNEPAAPPAFYTHHPYGMKLLMQQVMQFSGHGEGASRGFSLAVAMCAALGVLATLSILSGDIFCGAIGAAVFVSLPVMAIYQTCVKFEIDGMASSAWIFPGIVAFVGRPTGARRALLVMLGLGAVLSAWTGLMFAGIVSAALIVSGDRASPRASAGAVRAAGVWLAVGITLGGLALLSAFVWQKGGIGAFSADLGGAFRVHSVRAGFTNGEWVTRQIEYTRGNFGILGTALLGCGIGMVVWRMLRRGSPALNASAHRGHPGLLFLFLWVSLATTILWVVVFREGRYVHEYWSLVGCMPVAVTACMVVLACPPAHKTAARCASALVVTLMYGIAWQAFASRLESIRGEETLADVEFVMSFKPERFDRFVFVPLGEHPFNHWFHPRLFEYYTDRTLSPIAAAGPVGKGDKLILLAYTEQQAAEEAVARGLGIELTNRRCGPRFCVYDVLPASGTARRTLSTSE